MRSRDLSGMAGTVRLTRSDGLSWRGTAEADGRFRIGGLPRATGFDFEAAAPGCAPFRIPWIYLGKVEDLDLETVPLGSGIDVEVLVVDSEGAPVPGATVQFRRPTGGEYLLRGYSPRPPEGRGSTGPDGRASLPAMAAGNWTVDAEAPGLSAERQGVHLREGEWRNPLRIVLSPSCTLRGRVFDEEGTPIRGVSVQAVRGEWWWVNDSPRGEGISDDEGNYRIERLGPGSHLLAVRTPGGGVESAGMVAIAGETEHEIRLAARASLRGRVEDAATGAPVEGAELEVRFENRTQDRQSPFARASSDAAGSFSLSGLPAVRIQSLTVAAAGFVPYPDSRTPVRAVPDDLSRGEERELRILLHRGAAVRGTARDREGRPVPGAWISMVTARTGGDLLWGATVRTDGEGCFLFASANPGRNLFRAGARNLHLAGMPEDYKAALRSETPPPECTLEVPESGEVVKDLVLVPDCRVTGKMTFRDGTPAAGIIPLLVRAEEPSARRGEGRPSGQDGSFVIDDVAPEPGDYRVAAAGPAGRLGLSEKFALAESAAVADLVVTVARPATLEGRVRRADGRPVGAATVRVVPRRYERPSDYEWRSVLEAAPRTTAAADGSFRVEGLVPGPNTPVAAATGCVDTSGPCVDLGDGERRTGVEIVLPEGRAIAGRVQDASGRPVAGIRIEAKPVPEEEGGAPSTPVPEGPGPPIVVGLDAESDSEGRFLLQGLPAGACEVRASGRRFVPWTGRAEAGATDLRILLQAGLSIEGRAVEAETRKPVEGLTLSYYGENGAYGSVRTAADGSFAVEGLSEGAYNLDFSDYSRGTDAGWAPKSLRRVRTGTRDLVVEFEAGLVVEGKCVDSSGGPIDARNMTVGIRPAVQIRYVGSSTSLEADGRFRFNKLLPGRYLVTAGPQGRRGAAGAYLPRSVEVEAGERRALLPLTRGKSITGRVLAADGEPLGKKFSLRARPAGGGAAAPNCNMYERVQEDGSFVTDPFEDGVAQDIWAETDGLLFTAVVRDVQPGSTGVTLKLEKSLAISGTVLAAGGVSAAGSLVWAECATGGPRTIYTEARRDGSFTIENLPPGNYRLFARSRERNLAPVAPSAMVAPGSTGLEVRTAPGNELRLRIRRADGTALGEDVFLRLDFSWEGRTDYDFLKREGDLFTQWALPPCTVKVRLGEGGRYLPPGEGVIATLEVPCEEQTITVPRRE